MLETIVMFILSYPFLHESVNHPSELSVFIKYYLDHYSDPLFITSTNIKEHGQAVFPHSS